jgi:hypothetical protein
MIVDSNFFIQAHRANYPIDKVKAELYKNNDALTAWCQSNIHDSFFLDSASVATQYAIVIQQTILRKPPYNQGALDTFFDATEADAWLIAHALAGNSPIVTHETAQPMGIARVKIPDICNLVGIRTLSTIDMFRELGENF